MKKGERREGIRRGNEMQREEGVKNEGERGGDGGRDEIE